MEMNKWWAITGLALQAARGLKKQEALRMIGFLGNDPGSGMQFFVSRDVFRTPKNMTWGGSARYATHDRHVTHALTEFTGLDPDSFSFDMLLTTELGVDPMCDLAKLWTWERDGEALGLVIGGHAYGKYRWTIKKHSTKLEYTDAAGNLYAVEVSVELLAYLKEESNNTGKKQVQTTAKPAAQSAAQPAAQPAAKMAARPAQATAAAGGGRAGSVSGGTSYTVKKGDNLWNLARKFYGSGADYKKIYEANRNTIGKNPNALHAGQTLTIPAKGGS